MPNATRQVSSIEEWFLGQLRQLGSWRHAEILKAKRHYPGEAEAGYLLAFIDSASEPKQKEFLKLLRRPNSACEKMEDFIDPENLTWRVSRDGIVLLPGDPEGVAVLAILLLEFQGQLRQIKRCLHCGARFYARFESQQFCPNPKTNCQWNHFHSPAQRKQYRERNRRHQREYRKRNPGRRH